MPDDTPPFDPRSLQALRDSEATSRAIIDSAVDGIVTIDESGIIESVNPAVVRLFLYTADELIGRNVSILMPSPYREGHDAYLEQFRRTGVKKIIGIGREVAGRRKDGTVFPIHLAVSEVHLARRRLFTGVIHDITQLKRDEERMRELQDVATQRERLADVGAITAQIVHDLGNPLGGLSLQAQRLARQIKRDPEQPIASMSEAVERIVAIVRRLDELVHEFMNFAREQRLEVKPIPLRRFLAEVADEWQALATARGIELRLDASGGPEQFEGDEEKLRRVLENLVKNAIEAIGAGPGKVVIRTSVPSGEKLRISVEDSGPGVAEGIELFKLFETTKPEGTGFGLAIAKQIMLAHGGDIHFHPRDPGGAVFCIDIPCAPGAIGE